VGCRSSLTAKLCASCGVNQYRVRENLVRGSRRSFSQKCCSTPSSRRQLSTLLSRLSSITVACHDRDDSLRLKAILPFLLPPSVAKAEFSFIEDDAVIDDRTPDLPTDTLLLNFGLIDSGALISFLRCFKNLGKFRYDPVGRTGENWDFLPQKVGEAIAYLKHGLEDLEIRTDRIVEEYAYGAEDRTRIGYLRKF